MLHRRVTSSATLCLAGLLIGLPLRGQVILQYAFEDGKFGDFINPVGLEAIDLCGQKLPAGEAALDAGNLLITNDEFLGLAIVALDPAVVEASFPGASRDYILDVDVNLESVNELSVYVRGRLGFVEGTEQIDSNRERGYVVSVIPEGTQAAAPDGFIAVSEFTACHDLVPHPEWPGATPDGFAAVAAAQPIRAGDWYHLSIAVQGNDDGGPVTLDVSFHPIDNEQAAARVILTDPNGLPHSPETLDPSADAQVVFGTSFDFDQQPGATCRIDNLKLTALEGCPVAPAKVTRALWGDKVLAEGTETALYTAGGEYQVTLAVSDPRPAGQCAAASQVVVADRLPPGWTAKNISNGGLLGGDTVTWNLTLPAAAGTSLTYTAVAAGSGRVDFSGKLNDLASSLAFVVEGESAAVDGSALPQISDFGSIQHWLILGPFTRQVEGANPGDDQLVRDYLTDGSVTEGDIAPSAGDTIEPDYGGAAASTGLLPNLLGRNPGDVPTWIEWRDYDDADDRVDFERVYGDLNQVMCYALTYLEVEDDVVVNFGVSSDDSVQVLLDGEELHKNNAARGALDRRYQDTPLSHPNLGNVTLTAGTHTLVVKVFEGGGEHNFRVGFLDDQGTEIPGGPDGVTVVLTPPEPPQGPFFRRGDADTSGKLDISDAVFTLNYLFSGGRAPTCLDAADSDDNGAIQISDPVRSLGFLFLGTQPPAAPGPENCGLDVAEDGLEACVYAPPAGTACE